MRSTVAARGGPSELLASRVSDPRIQHGVQEIHEEIHEDDDRDHEQVDALDHRVVALENRVEEKAAHARQLEDGLDDDGSAEDLRELYAEDGDHGDEGVLQTVLEDDHAFAQSLGPRRAYVVLAQHFEQHGAGEAHDPRRGGDAQDEGGQDELEDVRAGGLAELREAQVRCPSPPDGGKDDDEGGDPEARNGQPDDGRAARDVVAHAVRPHRRQYADGDGDDR